MQGGVGAVGLAVLDQQDAAAEGAGRGDLAFFVEAERNVRREVIALRGLGLMDRVLRVEQETADLMLIFAGRPFFDYGAVFVEDLELRPRQCRAGLLVDLLDRDGAVGFGSGDLQREFGMVGLGQHLSLQHAIHCITAVQLRVKSVVPNLKSGEAQNIIGLGARIHEFFDWDIAIILSVCI